MTRRPPRSTRTDTRVPYTARFRSRATSRLTQAPHSRAQTVSRTPPSRSASGRLKDCNWRTSAIDSLLGCGRSEGCFEALQEARDPRQHHAEHGGDEGTLQVLGESDPADRDRKSTRLNSSH